MDFLRQMVEINSWTRNPSGVNQLARFTAQVFAPLGFTAEFVQSALDGFNGTFLSHHKISFESLLTYSLQYVYSATAKQVLERLSQ